MKFSEVKEMVLNVTLAGYVPFIRGLHGIGKSEMIELIANQISDIKGKDVTLHTVDMSHIKEGELTGMPITGKDPETGCLINSYTTYNLFNDVIRESNEGLIPIIFFDEVNRADRVVFNELMPIILNKRVQEIYLPDETIIITAGNPEDVSKYKGATDDYSVLPMDPALKDRFFIFELDVDPIEWLNWANDTNEDNEKNIDIDVIEFITEYPNMLHFLSEAEINPTPRAWKMFSDVYTRIKNNGKDFNDYKESIFILGGSKIGSDTTINFVRFLSENNNPILKAKDFFGVNDETFDRNIKKLVADTPTRQYMSMKYSTEYYIEKLEALKTKKKEKENLVDTYMKILWSMPKDILIGTLKELMTNNKKALNEITKRDPKKIIEVQKYLV
jgi:hypothetical protein